MWALSLYDQEGTTRCFLGSETKQAAGKPRNRTESKGSQVLHKDGRDRISRKPLWAFLPFLPEIALGHLFFANGSREPD